MNELQKLLAHLTDDKGTDLAVELDNFILQRVSCYQTSVNFNEISQRIDQLREQLPQNAIGIFFELDEAYGELMGEQNKLIYKQGFAECLQFLGSIGVIGTFTIDRKGEHLS